MTQQESNCDAGQNEVICWSTSLSRQGVRSSSQSGAPDFKYSVVHQYSAAGHWNVSTRTGLFVLDNIVNKAKIFEHVLCIKHPAHLITKFNFHMY